MGIEDRDRQFDKLKINARARREAKLGTTGEDEAKR